MTPDQRPPRSNPRCPRCDEELSVSLIGRGGSRRLVLVCPEPYCEYTWAPTRAELARMTRGEPGPDGITRAAG